MKASLCLVTSILVMAFCSACTKNSSPPNNAVVSESGSGAMVLTSPVISKNGALPSSLKCERDGGTGSSPPLDWTAPPSGTETFAIAMEHYPNGTTPGIDRPSQYWLLWNLPGDTRRLSQGNVEGIGVLGSDKDGVTAGYTPPCSPPGPTHSYTIRLYALSGAPSELGVADDVTVDWADLTTAIAPLTLGTAELTFTN